MAKSKKSKGKRMASTRGSATRVAQTPLANALSGLIDEVTSKMPRGSAIKTQAERNSLRRQGYVSRGLVQTLSALLASRRIDVKVKLDPTAAPNTVAHVTAFWPLIAKMRSVATLLEDSLLREAGALGAAVSSAAGVITSHAKDDP